MGPYFFISMEIVNGRRQARKSKAVGNNQVAAEELIRTSSSPLSVSLLAGPGAITSIIVFGISVLIEGNLMRAKGIDVSWSRATNYFFKSLKKNSPTNTASG